MKWGIFDHVDASGLPAADHYATRLDLIGAIDRLGFDAYFIAEHHGTPLGYAPSPSVFLSSIAQRTTRLRFGPLVYLAALYHPIRLAEEVCMLDQLSRGRLLMGLGRGGVPIEAEMYGVPPDDVRPRYEENRDILLAALTHDEVTFAGEHHSFDKYPMMLRPYQRPHPPIWYGLGSVESAIWAADNAVNCVALQPAARCAPVFDAYRERWAANGAGGEMPLLGPNRHIVVAESAAEARRIAEPAFHAWRGSFSALWRRVGRPLPIPYPETWEALEAAKLAIAGTPAMVADYIEEQRVATGATYFGSQMIFGTMPREAALASLEAFAEGVMPAFERQPALIAASA